MKHCPNLFLTMSCMRVYMYIPAYCSRLFYHAHARACTCKLCVAYAAPPGPRILRLILMAAFPLYSNFAELALSEEGSTTTADNRTPFPEDHELGCTFVSTPPPDLLCRVCGLVLRDPHQTQCCGNHYCGYCLRIQLNARSQCAFCSSRQVHSFRDVSVTRRINKLQVRCPHQDRGCGWSGELGGVGCHLETCVGKPRACRSCGGVFSNKVIAKHEKTLCYKRKFQCPHCKHCNSTYERVRDIHWPKCLLFPISCPNDCKCNIPRKDVLKHLREGCDVKKKLSQLSATVDQLQTQLTEKEAEIKELQLKVSTLLLKQLDLSCTE